MIKRTRKKRTKRAAEKGQNGQLKRDKKDYKKDKMDGSYKTVFYCNSAHMICIGKIPYSLLLAPIGFS